MYQPRPLDTEGVELPEELLELTERLRRTSMRCGRRAGWRKAGRTGRRRT